MMIGEIPSGGAFQMISSPAPGDRENFSHPTMLDVLNKTKLIKLQNITFTSFKSNEQAESCNYEGLVMVILIIVRYMNGEQQFSDGRHGYTTQKITKTTFKPKD